MMRNSIPCLGIIRIRCKGFDLSLYFNPQADKAPLLLLCGKSKNKKYMARSQPCFFLILRCGRRAKAGAGCRSRC